MALYEYKVVPAPRKGRKSKGVKSAEDRFSLALQELMNEHGEQGWEYQRAETLPSDERQGLTGSQTVYRDVLVFRRERAVVEESVHEETIETPDRVAAPVEPPMTSDTYQPSEPSFETAQLPPEPTLDQQTAWDISETDGDAGQDSFAADPNRRV